MTGTNVAFITVGVLALLAGGTMLARPAIARGLIGLEDSEGATYALRIGGAMVAAFGLDLIVLTVTFVTAAGAS